MATNSDLQIRLFDGFHVTNGDKTISGLHSIRLQTLLAYLLLHRDAPQSRQYLSFRFWPDSSEAQARTNLRQLLHHLRQALPDADTFLLCDMQTVRWNPDTPFFLDVAAFEQAIAQAKVSAEQNDRIAMAESFQKAAELYRGDLFPECYEEWIEPVRNSLKKKYSSALQRLIEYFETTRDYTKAITYAEWLLYCDNLHEKTYVDLIRLHSLNGDRPKALQIYRQCEEVLDHEFGIEPCSETQKTAERLTTESFPEKTDEASKAGKHLSPDWELVGRKHSWKTLLNNWKQTLNGACRFVCISGEPGIGKSRLGLELLEYVRKQGYTTAYSRSYETAGILSYGPITDWLKEERFRKQFSGLNHVWLKELARLLPELLVTFPELPQPGLLNEKWKQRHFFEALTKVFLAEQKPKLLFLDDLQWCDRETLEWLVFLFNTGETANLLVVGTLRPMEGISNKPLQNLLANLRNTDNIEKINLESLDEPGSLELAAQVAGSNINTNPNIYRESGGNPLFVVEMVRQGFSRDTVLEKERPWFNLDTGGKDESTPLPPKVTDVISARLEQLTERSRELMWLAAAIGREFRFDILVHASDLEETAIIRSLEELLNHHIIRELHSGTYDFSHDKLREVAAHSMSSTWKRYLHKQIAGAIEVLHGDNLKAFGSRLAHHYDRAGLVEKAIASYKMASEYARQIYAIEEAVWLLKRAITLLKQMPENEDRDRLERDLQSELVLTLFHINYVSDEIRDACSRVFSLSETLDEPVPVPVKRIFAIVYLAIGNLNVAVQLGKESYNHAESAGDNIEFVEACYVLGVTLSRQARYPEVKRFFKEGLDRYNPADQKNHIHRFGQDPSVICMIRLAMVEWLTGNNDKSQTLGEEALKLAKKINHPFTLDYVKTHAAWLCNLKHDVSATLKLSEEVLTTSYDHGFAGWISLCEMLAGYSQFHLGLKEQGITRMREGFQVFEIAGIWVERPYFNSLFAEMLCEQEEWVEAIALSDRAVKQMKETGYQWMIPEIYRIRGDIYLKKRPSDVMKAKKNFRKALSVSRRHHALFFEQRALASLEKIK